MEYLRQQAVAHHDAVTTKLRTHRYFNWNGVKYYILDCINPDALFEQRKNVLDQIPQRCGRSHRMRETRGRRERGRRRERT